MNYLKSYKLFEADSIEEVNQTLDDICLDLKDDGWHVRIVKNKYGTTKYSTLLITKKQSSSFNRYEQDALFKENEVSGITNRIINYLDDRFINLKLCRPNYTDKDGIISGNWNDVSKSHVVHMENSSRECLGLKFDFNDSHHFNDKQTELFESNESSDIITTLKDIGLDIKDEGCNMSIHKSYEGSIVLEVNAGINPNPNAVSEFWGRYNILHINKINETLNRMIKYMDSEGYIRYEITGISDHLRMRRVEWDYLFPYDRTEFQIYGIQIEFKKHNISEAIHQSPEATDIRSQIMECFYDLEDDGFDINFRVELEKRISEDATIPDMISVDITKPSIGYFPYGGVSDYLDLLKILDSSYKITEMTGPQKSIRTNGNIYPSKDLMNDDVYFGINLSYITIKLRLKS